MKTYQLTQLSETEIRNHSAREYNNAYWQQRISDYLSYGTDTKFYMLPKGNGYDYDRFYVVYQLPEGLIVLNDFGYSSCISNCGFMRAGITMDGTLRIFGITDGGTGRAGNTTSNRKILSQLSKDHGMIFTTVF